MIKDFQKIMTLETKTNVYAFYLLCDNVNMGLMTKTPKSKILSSFMAIQTFDDEKNCLADMLRQATIIASIEKDWPIVSINKDFDYRIMEELKEYDENTELLKRVINHDYHEFN